MFIARYTRKRAAGLAITVAAASALAACGSDATGPTKASSGAASSAAAKSAQTPCASSTAVDPSYGGTDKGYFTTLPQPTVNSGRKFKIGFLNTNGGQPFLVAMQKAAQAEVQKFGGSFIGLDAESNPQKQASQLNQLIAQKVDVIIGFPVVAAALRPGIAAARKAGIPFVAIGATSDLTQPPLPEVVTSISQGYDYSVYCAMKALAAQHPGAPFATMGLSIPVDQLIFMLKRMKYWGEHFGLPFLGQVDTTNDNPTGFGPAAQTILSKYSSVKLIVTFNDQSAVAAATTVATSGKGEDVKVATPNSATSIARDALEAGRLDLVYRTPWEQIGVQSAIAAYDTLTRQQQPLPKFIVIPGRIVMSEDASKARWVQ